MARLTTDELQGRQSKVGHKFHQESYRTWPIEENPFPLLYFDITEKCNMHCNVCYFNYKKKIEDMDIKYYEECIKRLPYETDIRILGGEPTLHPDIFRFFEIAHENGHTVFLSTNGVLLNDINFAKEIREHQKRGKLEIHMDMTGGKRKEVYKITHNDENTYEMKIGALENLKRVKYRGLALAATMIHGVNDSFIIEEMFDLAKEYRNILRYLVFRSQGHGGRYIKEGKSYTLNEWWKLAIDKGLYIPERDFPNTLMAGWIDKRCKGKHCCMYYKRSIFLNVLFLTFFNDTCWMRGQARDDFKVEYMFESMQANAKDGTK